MRSLVLSRLDRTSQPKRCMLSLVYFILWLKISDSSISVCLSCICSLSLPRGPILLEELWLVQTPVPQLVVFHQRFGNEGSGGTLLLFFKVLFSFHMMFVVFSFNRCLFFIQSMLSAAGSLVQAFAAYLCLFLFNCFDIHSIYSKCPPLFH